MVKFHSIVDPYDLITRKSLKNDPLLFPRQYAHVKVSLWRPKCPRVLNWYTLTYLQGVNVEASVQMYSYDIALQVPMGA